MTKALDKQCPDLKRQIMQDSLAADYISGVFMVLKSIFNHSLHPFAMG